MRVLLVLLALLPRLALAEADAGDSPDAAVPAPAAGSAAAMPDYEVLIDAPPPLQVLLRDNLSLNKWRGNERMDRAQLRRLYTAARGEIETLVATEGYYAPTITSSLEQEGARWIARFKVEPNAAVRVAEVRLTFSGAILTQAADALPDPTRLRADWALPAGQVFRQADWESAKRKLLQQLLIERFPLARLTDTRADVDVDTGRVILDVQVDSGAPVRFGALHVSGLSRYPESVLTNLNPIRPGEPYRQSQLLEFQRRLQDSGYFTRVDVHADTPANDDANIRDNAEITAPVEVAVEESPVKRVSLGAGFSTNTGYRAQVGYDQLNLFGEAVQLKTAVVMETKQQTAGADFILPVTPEGYRHTVSTGYKREDIEGEVTRTWSASARRAWGPERTERNVSLDFVRERSEAGGIDSGINQSLAATYGVTFRRTDSLLAPSRGYVLNAQAGLGARLSSGQPFSRLYGRYAGYFPIRLADADNTLIVRAEGGAVVGHDRASIPSDLLFRAGGDQSVRGYGYQSLGVTQNGAIVGGRYLLTGSVEAIHWFGARLPNWGAAVFVDAGNAADTMRDLKPATGYGAGARWRSPVGVLNLDLAYGRDVHKARLHFSVGVAF